MQVCSAFFNTYIHTYIHTYIYIYIYMRNHVCMHILLEGRPMHSSLVYLHTYIYTFRPFSRTPPSFISCYFRAYVHIRTHIYILYIFLIQSICTHMYTHVHTFRSIVPPSHTSTLVFVPPSHTSTLVFCIGNSRIGIRTYT